MYANHPGYSRQPFAVNSGRPFQSEGPLTNGSAASSLGNGRSGGQPTAIPDVLVKQFYDDQIIQTVNRDNDIVYHCFYCSNNIKDLSKVAAHVTKIHHIQNKNSNRHDRGLNKKFIIRSIDDKDIGHLSEIERRELMCRELDRIPNDAKHYFCRRGVRLMNGIGELAFFCKTCEQPISSFTHIMSHLRSESHIKLEKREILFDHINEHENTFKKNAIPITGLKYITEYRNHTLTEILYQCNLCQYFDNAYKMYLHLISFEHRINLLNQLEGTNYDNLSKDQLNCVLNAYKQRDGLGYITKTNEMPVVFGNDWSQSLEQIRSIFGSHRTKTFDSMKQLFEVRIRNEFEANAVVEVIEKIKEATIKYYADRDGAD